MAYTAPVPPLGEARVGHHDRRGAPQDVLQGEVVSGPATTPRAARRAPGTSYPARRSVGVAVLLAALLGPIGLAYSSLLGAGITSAVLLILALPVLPFYPPWVFVALALTLPMCVMWALFATLAHNTRVAWLQHLR
ncbi:MAG: hypothetical protein Q4G43_08520 [Mobilicoccus sp.]|nr:hypothetical protein [Mobilicoccus sp.]